MTRAECEKLIAEKLHEITDIYLQYNPDGKYLTLYFQRDDNGTYYAFGNEYWDEAKDEDGNITREEGADVNIPVDYWEPIYNKKDGNEDV